MNKAERINQIVEQIESLQFELASLENYPKMIKPNQDNIQKINEACKLYIDCLVNGQQNMNDEKHYIFQTAMEFTYGKDVWEWIRNK